MAFFKPWETVGDRRNVSAYHKADTFEDALKGFRRHRKRKIFHMPNTGEAGERHCVVCGAKLNALAAQGEIKSGRTTVAYGAQSGASRTDTNSTWTYDPARKAVGNGMHYGCSWSALMLNIFVTHDKMQGV